MIDLSSVRNHRQRTVDAPFPAGGQNVPGSELYRGRRAHFLQNYPASCINHPCGWPPFMRETGGPANREPKLLISTSSHHPTSRLAPLMRGDRGSRRTGILVAGGRRKPGEILIPICSHHPSSRMAPLMGADREPGRTGSPWKAEERFTSTSSHHPTSRLAPLVRGDRDPAKAGARNEFKPGQGDWVALTQSLLASGVPFAALGLWIS